MTSPRKRIAGNDRRPTRTRDAAEPNSTKKAATAKPKQAAVRTPSKGPEAEPATLNADAQQHLQILAELTSQARVLTDALRDALGEAQRHVLAVSNQLTGKLEEVGRLSQEAESARRTWTGFSSEITDLLRDVRGLKVRPAEQTGTVPEPEPVPAPTREKGWLGVTVEPALVVVEVLVETPAEAAGLVAGDVITGIGGVRVLDARQMQEMIQEEAGEEVTLQLVRGEEKRVIRVQLAAGAPAQVDPDQEE